MLRMDFKYNKQSIVTGLLNCFCISCDLHVSRDELDEHVSLSKHKENIISSISYEENYKEEHILKSPNGYYCMYCNALLHSLLRVKMHVTGEEHIKNVGCLHLKQEGAVVTAFKNVVISDKAWHGFVGESCVICDLDYDDEEEHRNNAKHILNLIQSNLQFEEKKNIYRKIDANTIQCLTCNGLYPTGSLGNHMLNSDHTKLYTTHQIVRNGFNSEHLQKDLITTETNKHALIHDNGAEIVDEESTENQQDAILTDIIDKEKKINDDVNHVDYVENTNSFPNKVANNQNAKTTMSSNISRSNDHGAKIVAVESSTENQPLTILKDINDNEQKINNDDDHVDFVEKNLNNVPNKEANNQNDKAIKSSNLMETNKFALVKYHGAKIMPAESSTANQPLTRLKDINDNEPKINDDFEQVDCVEKKTNSIPNKKDNNEKGKVPENTNLMSPGQSFQGIMNFAKKHKLKYKRGKHSAYCSICDTRFTSTFKCMKEHVETSLHKENAAKNEKLQKERRSKIFHNKMLSSRFIDTCYVHVPSQDVIINKTFCISRLSLHLASKIDNNFRCQVCNATLPMAMFQYHTDLDSHNDALIKIPIIISLTTEFVREVRPNLYHCGFCNLMMYELEELDKHLKSEQHNISKKSANCKLQFHLPDLEAYEHLKFITILRFLLRRRY